MKSPHSFGKDERLSRKRDIEELFQKGSYFYLYPFRIMYQQHSLEKTQLLVSVSKRNFKKAVDRNLLKRRIREGYRLHKHLLKSDPLRVAFIYTAKEILPSDKIHASVIKALSRLNAGLQ